MARLIIIEDEPKAANELKSILKEVAPEMEVLKILTSVEESVDWFKRNEEPDIIFSDIQLSDGLSFDVFRRITLFSPIIFCTAFDEYILRAFEVNGISYLLKPISRAKVEESLRKYGDLKLALSKNRINHINQLDKLLSQWQPSYQSTLLINVREKIVPVKVTDVAYMYYNNGVVSVILLNKKNYHIQDTLEDLEAKLDPNLFFRINRQFVVNRGSIKEIERYFTRKLVVKLSVGEPEPIIVSKLKTTVFLDWVKRSAS